MAVTVLKRALTPGVLYIDQAMLDSVLPAAHLEHVRDVSRWTIGVGRWEGELDAPRHRARTDGTFNGSISENGMDAVGHGIDQDHEEGGGRGSAGLASDLDESDFSRAVNGD